MLTSGNRLLDVVIVFVVVYFLCEGCIWVYKKFIMKRKVEPVGGVYNDVEDNSSK